MPILLRVEDDCQNNVDYKLIEHYLESQMSIEEIINSEISKYDSDAVIQLIYPDHTEYFTQYDLHFKTRN